MSYILLNVDIYICIYIYVYYILFMLTDRCAVSICDAPPNGGRVTLAVFMCVVFFFCG